MKVVVGLSGGVDSAVSAALLQREGYEVVGVFIKIWSPEFIACTWEEDRLSAKRVAAHLGIPFKEVDASERYKELVVQPMVRAYAAGQTPNPDVLCNQYVKFVILSEVAEAYSATRLATGHYAQVRVEDTRACLLKGVDRKKDQSYFLYRVPQEILAKTLFPIGEYTKEEVRALALKFKLPNATRKDSQGICFIGDISIGEFLEQYVPVSEGKVLDTNGTVVGTHRGAPQYTRGMRHGFTLFDSHLPRYVVSTDVQQNTITVDDAVDASSAAFLLADPVWIREVPLGKVEVSLRYRQNPVPAFLESNSGVYTVRTDAPVIATAGQSAVLYREDECLGGGIIV